jgi:glycosyl transferase family 87
MKKRPRTLLLLACSILVALVGFLFIRNLIDFPVYYAAGRSLLSGRSDLYAPDFALGPVMDYRYPPFFVVALAPLWLLPYALASYIWFLLSALEIAGCGLIVARTFPAFRGSMKMWVVVSLATVQYFVMALHYGNAHLLTTFLLFASFYFFARHKDLSAGLMMALAITIKLTPLMLLPFFAVKRRWKSLIATFVFLVAFNLAPSAYFGLRGNSDLLYDWYRHVVASQEFHEENGPINLSLKGQLRRYLSTVDYRQRVDGDVNYPVLNLASLSREQTVRAWVIIAAGIFVGVLLFVWRTSGGSQAGTIKDILEREILSNELSVMVCLMLLVGPLTSKIYFIALIWPVANLADIAVDHNTREGQLSMRILVVVAIINSILPLLPGRAVQRLLLVLGVDFYVNCLVMAALFYSLAYRRLIRKRSVEPRTRALSEAKMP